MSEDDGKAGNQPPGYGPPPHGYAYGPPPYQGWPPYGPPPSWYGWWPPGPPPWAGAHYGSGGHHHPGRAGGGNEEHEGPPHRGPDHHPHHHHGRHHGHPGGHPGQDHHVDLLTGLALGAVAAYLLSNEQTQRAIIRSAVSLWSTFQGSFEELKERVRDAEAELRHAAEAAANGEGAPTAAPDEGNQA